MLLVWSFVIEGFYNLNPINAVTGETGLGK